MENWHTIDTQKSNAPYSLGNELKTYVEEMFQELLSKSPLLLAAKRGQMGAQEVANYVQNTLFLISHTPLFLMRAKTRALARGNKPLAEFYDIKIKEEDGHDKWALNDLGSLTQKFGVRPSDSLSENMIKLVDFIATSIDQRPDLYLAYILFAEHLTVLASPVLLGAIQQNCGVPGGMISVVGNHAELDKEHVVEMVEAVDRLSAGEKDRVSFRQVIERALTLHNAFGADIAAGIQ